MSNPRILIVSLGVIAVSFMALTLLPVPGTRFSIMDKGQNLDGNRATLTTEGSGITTEPNVMTFTQFFATLTTKEKTCVTKELKVERISALDKGNEAITDPELEILNKCVNPPTPKATAD